MISMMKLKRTKKVTLNRNKEKDVKVHEIAIKFAKAGFIFKPAFFYNHNFLQKILSVKPKTK